MQNKNTSKFVKQIGSNKCGCYVRNPITYGLKFKRAIVPLRSIDYHLEIVNSLAKITLKQTYYNPKGKYLEVDYSMPLSPESSIYKFQVEFNKVKIRGIVKDKEVAKKEYDIAKSQGRQAVLGTFDSQSRDIFNIQIGNIPPITQFVVTICLLQEMKVSLSTFYQLQIPSKISPRYMNKVNGVVRNSKKKKQQAQSSGPVDYKWSFRIDLKTTRRVTFFDTPSHSMKVINQNQAGTETLLEMEKSQIPHKDFVFLFTTEDFHLPSYVLGRTDINTTVMLSFIPKFCDLEVNDAYKSFIQNKPYEVDIQTAKGQYVFLLDRSGSMEGKRISQAKKSLILFLKSLPYDSYFNVVSFGSNYQQLFKEKIKTTAQRIDTAIKEIQKMSADYGGTEIYDPLLKLLKDQIVEGYPRHIFLLTDGDVENTQGVIRMVKKYTKYSRVHSIGIGSGASLSLIEGCAKSGMGKHIMISDDQNPSDKIIQLLQSTLTPLLYKMDLKYQTKQQIESIIPNPKSIPYILRDEVVNFFITFKGRLQRKTIFTFQYEDPISKLIYKSDIEVNIKSFNQPFVDKMAHLKVLRLLQNSAEEQNNIQDHMYYVKVKDLKQQAIDYSIKHQILSQYTAFSCIGKQLIDGKYQEYKDLGVRKIYVQQPGGYDSEQQEEEIKYGSYKTRFRYGNGGVRLYQQAEGCCAYGESDSGCQYGGGQQQEQQEYEQQKETQKETQTQKISQNISPVKDKFTNPEISELAQKNNQQQLELVEQVFRSQATDGSWNQPQLIQKLSKNPKTITEILKLFDSSVVITKLVINWFQKNHTQTQYRLIIKKGLAWLKKKIIQQKINQNQLNQIESI